MDMGLLRKKDQDSELGNNSRINIFCFPCNTEKLLSDWYHNDHCCKECRKQINKKSLEWRKAGTLKKIDHSKSKYVMDFIQMKPILHIIGKL